MRRVLLAVLLSPVVCAGVVILGVATLTLAAKLIPEPLEWTLRLVFGLVVWAASD